MIGIFLILISIFLALNMGVSGFSVSFTPSYGSRILTRKRSALLYGISLFAGGVLIGPRVVDTLSNKISFQPISPLSGFLILFSTAGMIFFSNLLRIPQSTSFVTVASFLGAGLYYGKVNWWMLYKILIFAILFSLLSFVFTFLIKGKIYPPDAKNLKFYENFHIHRHKFKKFIILTNIYSAFGIGTNNVANVVAPLTAGLSINPLLALAMFAPFFGLGAFLLGEKVIDTLSRNIVPLGEISATIISLITASFVILASWLGLPAPYVQFTTFSVLAISCVKDGVAHTCGKSLFKKLISVWILIPLLAAGLSFFLHLIILGRRI